MEAQWASGEWMGESQRKERQSRWESDPDAGCDSSLSNMAHKKTVIIDSIGWRPSLYHSIHYKTKTIHLALPYYVLANKLGNRTDSE